MSLFSVQQFSLRRCSRRFAIAVVGPLAVVSLGAFASAALANPFVKQLPTPSATIGQTWDVALSPDGKTLYVPSLANSALYAVPLADPQHPVKLGADVDATCAVAVSPDGKSLYATVWGAGVDIVDLRAGPDHGLIEGSVNPSSPAITSPCGLAVSPTGTQLYVTDEYDDYGLYDIALTNDGTQGQFAGQIADPHSYLQEPGPMALSPGGNTLYIPSFLNGLAIADVSHGAGDVAADSVQTLVPELFNDHGVAGNGIWGVALSPDGKTIYLAVNGYAPANASNTSYATQIVVINASTHRLINRIAGLNGPAGMAITNNGRTLYVAESGNNTLAAVHLSVSLRESQITGRARVGSKLTAHARSTNAGEHGAKLAYQWLAGGRPIRGVSSRSLKLRHGQLAKRVSVRVTATAPGLVRATRTSRQTKRVAAPPKRHQHRH